jgi:cell cycle sensor histidine kinase DivJ
VKFTPRGGSVTVTARAGSGGLVLAVSDTGTGIAKSDLEKLGRPFEQVESAQTRTKEGTGLGLALVKALAGMHGGDMVMDSALGEGTTVLLRLPYAAVGADGTRLQSAQFLPFRAA